MLLANYVPQHEVTGVQYALLARSVSERQRLLHLDLVQQSEF